MTILTSQLPSGGVGYDFPTLNLNPMTFLEMSEYLENLPKDDIDKYVYNLRWLAQEEPKILDCYIMDADFLVFYKKLISISGDLTYDLTVKCPECGANVKKKISLETDIHFKAIDPKIMNGAVIDLSGHKYEVHVPTVSDFLKVFDTFLRTHKVYDLKLIKTIALIEGFDTSGNQIEADVLGATHGESTLLVARRELYDDRVEPVKVFCPACNNKEERRSMAVSVDSLIVDFFRDLCNNSPIDGSKILFK